MMNELSEIEKEDNEKKTLMSESEAARFLGVHPITMARYRRAGVGPKHYFYPYGRIFYDKSDLIVWREDRIAIDRES
jgi:hypothetical protein